MRATLTQIFRRHYDDVVPNRRLSILHFEEAISFGVHGTLLAACDNYRRYLLDCTDYCENCAYDFHASMRQIDSTPQEVPVCSVYG